VILLAGCGEASRASNYSNWPPPTPRATSTLAPITGAASVDVPQAPAATAVAALPLVRAEATAAPTAPVPKPAPQMWRFVVLGDTRTSGLEPPPVTGQIVEQARPTAPHVVLAVGDLIKAMDDPESVRQQWRNWRATVAPLGPRHLLVTPGNHDVEGNAWATDLMAEAFPELPDNGPDGFTRLTYSVDYGGVRFISLHSEVFGDPHRLGDTQLTWLEAQLRNNPNRYTIVFSHDPAFPVGPHVGSSLDAYPQERDHFWGLLREYGVTAYIAGHEHLYNRQQFGGVTQLVVGTSGSWPYGGYGGDYFHYLVAEVKPEGLTMAVYDLGGAERDRFVLR
jgi:3',5'-cyclic AMP phosphodiesterase CpdA